MKSQGDCQLSFVIPTYNEAKRLPYRFEEITLFSKKISDKHEWIFVIEPSQDKTLQVIKDYCLKTPNARYIANEKKRGKGYAVQTGVLNASGKWVFFMDADLSTPLEEILNFKNAFNENPNHSVFIGSRKVKTSKIQKSQPKSRQLLSSSLNQLLRLVGLTEFKDTQCGFKAFHKKTIKPLFYNLKCKGFSFDIEILAKAKKHGFAIKEIGIQWKNDERSSVRPIRDGMRFIRDLFYIYYSLNK